MKKMVLKVGDRVKGVYDGKSYLGTVFSVSGNVATIRRNDGVSGAGDLVDGRFYRGNNGWQIERNAEGQFGADGNTGTLIVILKHRAKRELVAA